MTVSLRISMPLHHGLVAAAAIIAAACAGTPQRASAPAPSTSIVAPSTALAAESPMPASEVVQSADFSVKAAQEGFRTEVRNGTVLYCWTDASLGTRLPTKKCVNEAQLKSRMQAEERQREAIQRNHAAPNCTNAATC